MSSKEDLLKTFDSTIETCRDTLVRKNSDYGNDQGKDALENFRLYKLAGVSVSQGVYTRICDKMSRLSKVVDNKELQVTEETAEDTINDFINYLIILKLALKDNPNANRGT